MVLFCATAAEGWRIYCRDFAKDLDELGQDTMDEIERISDELSRKRGPAFYSEEIFSEQDAEQAKAGARMVLNFI